MESTLDRLRESLFHLDQLQENYHEADKFRWSLNCYLRALKEVNQIITMELQNKEGFKEWFISIISGLRSDPLISYLSKQRDIVVHKKMLVPSSNGTIGITEGRGIKLGLGMPINPLEDSRAAMLSYMWAIANGGKDVMGILDEDEESLPCVARSWRLSDFPDQELLDATSEAWATIADVVSQTVKWLGGEGIALAFQRKSDQDVFIRSFNRDELRDVVSKMKFDIAHSEDVVSK